MADREPEATRAEPEEPLAQDTLRERLFRGAMMIAFVAIAAAFFFRASPETLPEGEPAPALRAQLSSGEMFELGAQEGKIVVLNFWASWCPACRQEIPAIEATHQAMPSDARLIGVPIDRQSAAQAPALGLSMPQAALSQADLDRFQVSLLPTTIVIDARGQIAQTFTGGISAATLQAAIEDAR